MQKSMDANIKLSLQWCQLPGTFNAKNCHWFLQNSYSMTLGNTAQYSTTIYDRWLSTLNSNEMLHMLSDDIAIRNDIYKITYQAYHNLICWQVQVAVQVVNVSNWNGTVF